MILEIIICAECGDWVPPKQLGEPTPLYHCRACKNRNSFDIYPLKLGMKIKEIRNEY